MVSRVMRCRCPHCRTKVTQFISDSTANICPNCYKMFAMSDCRDVPSWVLGVLVVLTGMLLLRL